MTYRRHLLLHSEQHQTGPLSIGALYFKNYRQAIKWKHQLIRMREESGRDAASAALNWFRLNTAEPRSSIIQIQHGTETPPLRHVGQWPTHLGPTIPLRPLSEPSPPYWCKLALFDFANKLVRANKWHYWALALIERFDSIIIACGCRLIICCI